MYKNVEHYGTNLRFIDTAGIDKTLEDTFNEALIAQALLALDEADILIQVVDSRIGCLEADIQLSRMIHRSKKQSLPCRVRQM